MSIKTIAVCAYREWAIKTYINLQELFPSINFILIKSEDEFNQFSKRIDLKHLTNIFGVDF